MRLLFAGAAALAAVLASPAAADTGPFTGTVRQGQTQIHHYNNNPKNNACIDVMTNYTVVLQYAPASDTVSLSVGEQTVAGSNGSAIITVWRSYCTAFDITVIGTRVASFANYTVTVTRDGAGAIA